MIPISISYFDKLKYIIIVTNGYEIAFKNPYKSGIEAIARSF